MGDTEEKTTINEDLAEQSRYALQGARALNDRTDSLPSQYVAMSNPTLQAMGRIENIAGARGGSMAPRVGLSEWQKTMGGGYLDNNQYLDAIANRSANMAAGSQLSGFAGGGRFGSGAMSNAIADAMMSTTSNLYGQNYQNERNRMMQALGQTEMMERLQYADANRIMGVGQRYEADEAAKAAEAMRQYMDPYMRQQQFEMSLANNPLGAEKTVTKGFDWGGAMFGLAGSAMGGGMV